MSGSGQALTAVFIEPEGPLLSEIQERKAWLEARLPGQAYTSHPPHSTLLVGDYGPADQWRDALEASLRARPPFELLTEDWILFADDALAGGGQTVALRAALSSSLLDLQRGVAEALAPFHRGDATVHPLAQREPFATSLRHYGFPFVGSHWIPHFTVGSPRVTAHDPLVAELQRPPAKFRSAVNAISIWRVCGDEHVRSDVLALGGGGSRPSTA